jgi:putative membrane protein
MKIFVHLIVSTVAVFVSAYVLPGVHVRGMEAAFVAAIVIGVLNAFIKPILFVLTLPVTVLTLGFFMLVINAFLIMFADNLVDGFDVDGFWWAVIFSIVLSMIGGLLHSLEKKK